MGRRTDVQIVVDHFRRERGSHRVRTASRLVAYVIEANDSWTRDRAERAVYRATHGDDPPLYTSKGGALKYFGSDAAIYQDVRGALELWTTNKPWKVDEVIDVHSKKGRRGHGDWQYPDLIVLADPLRRLTSTAPLEIHAIEVEHRGGFSIRSVYQALEQGRGANAKWVFFVGDVAEWAPLTVKGRRQPKGTNRETRILRAAIEQGIGLVVMEQPHARSTWRKVCRPQRTLTDRIDREDRQALLEATKLVDRSLNERVAQRKRSV